MCQLFAVSSAGQITINNELSSFFDNSRIFRHGWGYADFSKGKTFIIKEPIQASESAYVKKLLSTPVRADSAVFHIRYATVGQIDNKNTHPFTAFDIAGRQWTLVHNGTVFECDALNNYFHKQNGSTDSERLLLYLVERINQKTQHRKRPLTDDERFETVESVITSVSQGNKLNLILHDSDILYVHANSKRDTSFGGTEYIFELSEGDSKLFCTVPLDDRAWKPIPLNRLLSFRSGEVQRIGRTHENEYIEKAEDIRLLYSEYADL